MYSHRDSKMQVPEIPKIPGMPSWLGGTFCLCVGGWWAVMRSRTESCSGGRGAMKNQNQNRSPRRVRMWMLTGSEESTAEGAGEKPSSAGIQVRSHMHARGGCQHGAASIQSPIHMYVRVWNFPSCKCLRSRRSQGCRAGWVVRFVCVSVGGGQ